MKPKTLIPLIAILAVLGGLVLLRQYRDKPVSITEQVKLEQLLPEGLDAGDVDTLELYAGGTPDEKLVLTRAGDEWIAATHFDAPVQDTKVQEYLDKLAALKGEFRASADDTNALAAYELDEDTAFHIVGRKKDSDENLFHVLVGKSPKYGEAFMRPADAQNVFVTDANLRQEAGIYSENMADPPKASTWLNKDILKVDQDGVHRLALSFPDKELVLEWQQTEYGKAVAEAAAKAAENTEGESEEPEIDVPPGPEYEWVVVEGGFDSDLNDAGVTSILSKLANLTATDIVDPAKKADWHLESPGYTARIQVEGQDEETVIEGGRDPADTDAYLQVASNDKDIVYKINKYGFEQVFPKGSALFTLPSVGAASTDVTEVAYTFDGHDIRLVKDGEEWTVAQPKADLPIVKSKPTSIAAAVAAWRADDYADPTTDAGLLLPSRAINFTLADGTTHEIVLGTPSKHIEGRYARYDGADPILVMSAIDERKIFVEPKDLYNRSMLDLNQSNVDRIEILPGGEGGAYTIERTEEGWKLLADTGELEADPDRVDLLLETIAGLEAVDLIFDEARTPGTVLGAVSLTMSDGAERRIEFELEQDGAHPATVSGIATPFLVAKQDVNSVLAPVDHLTPAPPEPAPAPEAEGASEAPPTMTEESPAAEAAPEAAAAEPAPEETGAEEAPAPPEATEESPTEAPPAEETPPAEEPEPNAA